MCHPNSQTWSKYGDHLRRINLTQRMIPAHTIKTSWRKTRSHILSTRYAIRMNPKWTHSWQKQTSRWSTFCRAWKKTFSAYSTTPATHPSNKPQTSNTAYRTSRTDKGIHRGVVHTAVKNMGEGEIRRTSTAVHQYQSPRNEIKPRWPQPRITQYCHHGARNAEQEETTVGSH